MTHKPILSPSGIPYVTHGWSPVTGCTPISAGCDHCWARLMLHRYRRPETPTVHLERMCAPVYRKQPALIFVCPMGDLFHEAVDDAVIAEVFVAMASAPQHRYLLLTKRPDRMAQWSTRFTDRLGVGVSVENQAAADERIPVLVKIPSKFRFLSMEPLLGPVLLHSSFLAVTP